MNAVITALIIALTLILLHIILQAAKAFLQPVPRALSVREYLAAQGMMWDASKLVYLRNNRTVEGWELREALKTFE